MASDDARRRSDALRRLHLLDGLPPASSDRVVRLASHVAGGGFSAGLHLLDDAWQHRVAGTGALRVREAVEDSFCIAVVRDDASLYTEDAGDEPRVATRRTTRSPAWRTVRCCRTGWPRR